MNNLPPWDVMDNLRGLQIKLWDWQERVFGPPTDDLKQFLTYGIVEEVGELFHHILKKRQGIRLDEDHNEGIYDAIGDIAIYSLNLMSALSLEPEWEETDVASDSNEVSLVKSLPDLFKSPYMVVRFFNILYRVSETSLGIEFLPCVQDVANLVMKRTYDDQKTRS